ncbi:hypothetical protein FOZ60_017025 [Perkinsus olseni]|uniref:Integrase catalytic domain-containing protein n=2 Tax=Perkinsus olseni TaxID=32597 RepID=A0A7J6N2F7_PEROL|nr:hypothetical protein FOZ60_017025 [Perkinsus olseni]
MLLHCARQQLHDLEDINTAGALRRERSKAAVRFSPRHPLLYAEPKQWVKKAIEVYSNDSDAEEDDDYNPEDDPDYNELLAEEDTLEAELSEAKVALAEAERAVDERIYYDTLRRLPPPIDDGQVPTGGTVNNGQVPIVVNPISNGQASAGDNPVDNGQVPTDGNPTPAAGTLPTGFRQPHDTLSIRDSVPASAKLWFLLCWTRSPSFNTLTSSAPSSRDMGMGQPITASFYPLMQETELVLKLLNSLAKCQEVHNLAVTTAAACKYKWSTIVTTLTRAFGKKTTLRTEVTKRLKSVRFSSVEMVEAFNQQVVSISNLWTSVYDNDPAEFRSLVQKFLAKLPADFLKAVTTQILAGLPQESAYRWEDHIQLHEDAPPAMCTPSICLTTTLTHVARSFEISESLQGHSGRRQDHSGDSEVRPIDSVLSGDSGSGDSLLLPATTTCTADFDVVQPVQILPEVTIDALFDEVPVRCVVDSAAGHSYVASCDVGALRTASLRLDHSSNVKVANGSVVTVNHCLLGRLTLLDCVLRRPVCSDHIEVRVLPSPSSLGHGERPTILLGRDLMDKLSIVVQARRCSRAGHVLYDYPVTVDELCSLLIDDDRVLRLAADGVGKPVDASSDANEFVLLPVSTEGQKKAECYCRSLQVREPFADDQRGFYSTLVPLGPSSERFPLHQTHQWQICCPAPKEIRRGHSYAEKMYGQLSTDRLAQYTALVDQYLQRRHWTPMAGDAGIGAAEVFMVGGVGTSVKGRLVCDFRGLNQALPKSSSSASFLPVVMAALRLSRPHAVVCADMHSAFYMLHLCDHEGCLNKLQLRCGDGRSFESSRVCFGAGFGPESLDRSLGRQRRQFLRDPPVRMRRSGLAQWVDDFIFFFGLMDLINIFTIFYHSSPVATLSLACDRNDRLQAARSILSQEQWCKTEIYAAAGGIGHDPVGLHGDVKPYCDATRRLFGGAFSKVSWGKPLVKAVFTEDQWLAWTTLRERLLSYVEEHLACGCDHTIAVSDGPVEKMVLRTDASQSGGGVYIFTLDSDNREVDIIRDAFCFTKTQQHYHSNRRELLCLYRGVCWIRRILSQMKDTSYGRTASSTTSITGETGLPTVVIQSDNSCSARWCLSSGSTLKVTAVERAAIVRLAAALGHELAEIKALGSNYVVEHLSGTCNETADKLSRALDIVIKGRSPLTLNALLNRCLDCPQTGAPTLPEAPSVVSEDCLRLVTTSLGVGNSPASEPAKTDVKSSRLSLLTSALGSFISDTLRLCWGMNQCCSLVAVYRWCWRVWFIQAKARKLPGRRRRACTLDYPDFPVLWDHEDLRHLLRADQATNPHIDTLPVADEKGTGPYFRLDDLVYFRSNSSNGTVVYRAVVSNSLRDFILRDIHRTYSHCGVLGMCSRFIEAFFCRALRSSAVQVRRLCPCCARLDARFSWSVPVGGPFFNVRSLLESPDYVSYSVVGIDFMTLAPGIKVLVCVCCATRHCTLLYCRREDTRHALQGVRELSLLRGKPVLLLSDRAAYFRSAEWTRSLRQQGIRAIHTASRAPWEGAVYERLNLEIRRMLKHVADIPKVQKLLKKFDPQSVNDTHSLRMMLP